MEGREQMTGRTAKCRLDSKDQTSQTGNVCTDTEAMEPSLPKKEEKSLYIVVMVICLGLCPKGWNGKMILEDIYGVRRSRTWPLDSVLEENKSTKMQFIAGFCS